MSYASAASRSVSPSAIVSVTGTSSTALTACTTVTVAVPKASPALAVIAAMPLPTAVTNPDASTVATEASLEDHETAAAAIACPFWSCTSALNCTVSSNALSMAAAGLTVTTSASGGRTGTGGLPPGDVGSESHVAAARTMRATAAC